MYSYAIGFDIGIASVGWAVVALDGEDRPFGIISMGSRIFDAAEQPKTGDSLAAPRREVRSAHRRLRRHQHRLERIHRLLIAEKVVSQAELDTLFEGKLEDIYALRVETLDAPVFNTGFVRILLHIAQRRGFRSNRKSGTSKEDGELLAAVTANRAFMSEKGYRTVDEMLLKDPQYRANKRNKGGKYLATAGRDMVKEEVCAIFKAQRKRGQTFAAAELEERYLEMLPSQRSFDESPGQGSPYGESQIEKMIGKCTLETGEPRAAKASYSFEYFTLLQNINHLRLMCGSESSPLFRAQRETLIALAHKTKDLKFSRIRKELGIPEGTTFHAVSYKNAEDDEETEKKTKFCYFRAYHQMRAAFSKLAKSHFDGLTRQQKNELGRVLSTYETSANIRPRLAAVGLSEREIDIMKKDMDENRALEFADFASGRKKHVTAVNGTVTSYMRKRWSIAKIRENGDLHHAVDALVIACTTDGMIQQVSRYAALRECEYVQTEADDTFQCEQLSTFSVVYYTIPRAR